MSTKYFCDFCKKEMPQKTKFIFAERVEECAVQTNDRRFEICSDCRDEMLEYIDDRLKEKRVSEEKSKNDS